MFITLHLSAVLPVSTEQKFYISTVVSCSTNRIKKKTSFLLIFDKFTIS